VNAFADGTVADGDRPTEATFSPPLWSHHPTPHLHPGCCNGSPAP
jgi:hypothetical protein